MVAALAACLLLTAAPAVRYHVTGRVETQVHTPLLSDYTTSPAVVDLLFLPSLLVQVRSPRADLTVSYELAPVFRNLESEPYPEVRHSAYLLGIFRVDPFTELDLSEVATYGHYPLEGGAQPGGLTPVVASQYFFSLTRLEALSSLGVRRLTLGVDLGWMVKGSAGFSTDPRPRPGEVRGPGMSGPLAKLTAQYYLTPRDLGALELRASQARFTNSRVTSTLVLAPSLTRHLSPVVQLKLEAGPALLGTQEPSAPPAPLVPVLAASASLKGPLSFARLFRVNAELEARLAPYVDDLEGSAYQRAELALALDWTYSRASRLQASLLAAHALSPGPQRHNAEARLDLVYRWNLSHPVALEASFQLAWTHHHLLPTSPLLQWLTSLALIIHHEYGRPGSPGLAQ